MLNNKVLALVAAIAVTTPNLWSSFSSSSSSSSSDSNSLFAEASVSFGHERLRQIPMIPPQWKKQRQLPEGEDSFLSVTPRKDAPEIMDIDEAQNDESESDDNDMDIDGVAKKRVPSKYLDQSMFKRELSMMNTAEDPCNGK
jgi:hypothetical protein